MVIEHLTNYARNPHRSWLLYCMLMMSLEGSNMILSFINIRKVTREVMKTEGEA